MKPSRVLAPAFAALALAMTASAPPSPVTAPPKRAHHALVYDEAAGRVLLTGGSSPHVNGDCCAFFNDLWAFDGMRWIALQSSGDPMSGMRLAFDPSAGRVVSFGGYSNRRSRSDLRALDDGMWKALGQHDAMPAAEPGFVYGSRRHTFVAFGGSAGRGQAHADTWTFDGVRWNKIAAAGPPARQGHVMAFDDKRGRTVVFGGTGAATPPNPPPALGDTWEFDGQRWTQIDAGPGPSPRHSAGVAFDSRRGLVIIFGGMDASGFLADTWAWDGHAWVRLAQSPTGPEPRAMGYLAYDKKRDRVVLFGGRKGWPNDLNDTWEWDGTSWRRVGQ